MKKLIAVVFVCLIGLAGCSEQTKSIPSVVGSGDLPPGITNEIDIGNRWKVFDLEIEGKKHRFLWKRPVMGGNDGILV